MSGRFAWSTFEVAARQVFQFVIVVVLARFVTPAEFGVMAIVVLFVAIGEMLAQSGLPSALIQKAEIDQADQSTAFWLCMATGGILAGALALGANAIARFYAEPILVPLTFVMSLQILFTCASAVQIARLTREGDFRRLALATIVSSVVSGCAAILLAVWGYGAWALAGQALLAAITRAAILWFIDEWRPSRKLDWGKARALFAYGGFLTAANMLQVVAQRFSTVVIGRAFGTTSLGYYNRADSLSQLLPGLMTAAYGRVLWVSLSRAADDAVEFARQAASGLVIQSLILAPAMIGIAVLARDLLVFLFGETWADSAGFLRVLALAGLLSPVVIVGYFGYLATARTRSLMIIEGLANAGLIGLLLGAAHLSLSLIPWSVVAGMAIRAALFSPLLIRVARHFRWHMWFDLTAIFLSAIAMGSVVDAFVARSAAAWPLVTRLASSISVGVAVYATGLLMASALRAAIVRALSDPARPPALREYLR